MYLVKTPQLIKKAFPNLIWDFKGAEKAVYLTFDDGPTPKVTDWVLNTLAQYNAQATFFCIGKNVLAHPEIYQQISVAGHRIGNHTHSHLNGWHTEDGEYLKEVEQCEKALNINSTTKKLFRPPYGRIKPSQIKALKPKYQIIMWDVLSGDFDNNVSGNQCATNVLSKVENGSIIVFHDSDKAKKQLKDALPKVLESLSNQGYRFKSV